MDWRFNTIWFDLIATNKQIQIDWGNENYSLDSDLSDVEYMITWHHKNKEKNLSNLPAIQRLKYLQLNWSNSLTLNGIEKFPLLKRLDISHCSKLETLGRITELSKPLEQLHLDSCRKLCKIDALPLLKNLRVLRLNSCANIESLSFLAAMPNLVDFRFVNTNVLDGNLDFILEHPTLCSIGSLDKRHYNRKINMIEAELKERSNKLALETLRENSRMTFAWPSSE